MSKYIVLITSLLYLLHAGTFYVDQKTETSFAKQYGGQAIKRLHALVDLMNRLQNGSEKQKLVEVNNFFNEVPYSSDMKVWGKSDYWANRMEFIGKDRGDCEDYTFAKYFTLKQLGIEAEKMRAFYCKSLTYKQAHMVLAYFRKPKSIPFVLGNYNYKILPATKRKDLKPIKLYNSEDLFLAKLKKMGQAVPSSKKSAMMWIELINGIRKR